MAHNVSRHHLSSRAIVATRESLGVTQSVTREASASLKADGSNGIDMYSSGCQATASPSRNKAGSCLAPLLEVNKDANANFDVSIVVAIEEDFYTKQ